MSTIHSELFYISHILTKTFKYLSWSVCVFFFCSFTYFILCLTWFTRRCLSIWAWFLLIYIFYFIHDMVYTYMFKYPVYILYMTCITRRCLSTWECSACVSCSVAFGETSWTTWNTSGTKPSTQPWILCLLMASKPSCPPPSALPEQVRR